MGKRGMPPATTTRFMTRRGNAMDIVGRSWLLGCLLLWMISSSASGETLLLEDGSSIDGVIMSATGTTLAIRLTTGGFRQLRRKDLAAVRLKLNDQTKIEGALRRWSNGIFGLQIGQAIVNVRDGEVIGMEEIESAGAAVNLGAGGPAEAIEPAAGRSGYLPPPIFILRGGETVVGRVHAFNHGSLMLRLATGGERLLQVVDINRIALRDPASTSLLEGRFLTWENGIYTIEVNGRPVRIRGGRPIDGKEPTPGGPVM